MPQPGPAHGAERISTARRAQRVAGRAQAASRRVWEALRTSFFSVFSCSGVPALHVGHRHVQDLSISRKFPSHPRRVRSGAQSSQAPVLRGGSIT